MGKKFWWIVGVIVCVSACLQVYGLKALLPSEVRAELVFQDAQERHLLIPEMIALRQKEYQNYKLVVRGNVLEQSDTASGDISRDKKITLLRAMLLGSGIVDDQHTVGYLSQLDPRKWNFDTVFYQYGGFYLYPLAVMLKLYAWCGLFELTPDIATYLRFPDEAGNLYYYIKVTGILFGLVSILVFAGLMKRYFSSGIVLLLVGLYATSVALVVPAQFAKPYVYVMAFVLLSFYCADTGKQKGFYWSAVCAGIAAGSVLPYGYIAVLSFAQYYWVRMRSDGDFSFSSFMVDACKYFGVVCGVYVLSNPFVLINFNHFMAEFSWYSGLPQETFWQKLRHARCFVEMLGVFGSMFFVLGAIQLFKKYSIGVCAWGIVLLPFVLLITLITTSVHYFIFFLPVCVYVCGWALNGRPGLMKKTCWAIAGLAIVCNTANAVYNKHLFTRVETNRRVVGEFINTAVPHGSHIGVIGPAKYCMHPYFQYLKYGIVENVFDKLKNGFRVVDYVVVDRVIDDQEVADLLKKDFTVMTEISRCETLGGWVLFSDLYNMNQPLVLYARKKGM